MIGFNTVYDVQTGSEFFVNSVKFTGEKMNFNGCNMFEVDLSPLDDESELPELLNVPLMVDNSSGEKKYYIALIGATIISGLSYYDFNDRKTSLNLYQVEFDSDSEELVIPSNAKQKDKKQTKTLVHITVNGTRRSYNSVNQFIDAVKMLKKFSANDKISISGVLYNE